MTNIVKVSSVLLGAVLLAGCGGSGGKAMIEDLGPTPTFSQMGAAADASGAAIGLLTDTEADDLGPALPSDLLTPGSATYDGQVAVLIGDSINDENREDLSDADVLGLVTLEVDFTTSGGSLSGEMYNFVDSEGELFSGELDIAETALTVDPTAVGVIAGVSGTLTDESNIDTDIEADLIGFFIEQGYFLGIAGGTVESQGLTDDFIGVLIAND